MRELTKMIGEIDEEDDVERKTELGLNTSENSSKKSSILEPEGDIFSKN